MAKEQDGVVASNNLRDVSQYVKEYSLKHITTGDILKEAFEKGIVNEDDANAIWAEMLRKRRKLGYESFSEYLHNNK